MKAYSLISVFLIIGMLTAMILPEDLTVILNNRLLQYNKENPSTNLFLHLDKSVYCQNEDIWFKAYVLSGMILDSKVLYVRITNEKKEIMLAEQFPMTDIRSYGDVLLPDTLKDGNYYLYAYTDRMINFAEEDIFVQRIKVQRNVSKRLEASASIVDTANIKRGQKIQVVVKLKEGINLLKGIRGKYELLDEKTILKNGRITTNLFGESIIEFTYPQLPENRSLKVRVVFNRNSDYAELELNLRHEANPVQIKVYPESGHLLQGFYSKMIVEALDINKYPLNVDLSLLENDKEIKRFKTNKYGIGCIYIKPSKDSRYAIRYIDKKKSAVVYPVVVESQGYNLSVSNQKDRLIAVIKNRGDSEKVTLVFRTLDEVLFSKPIIIPSGDSSVIPFIFKDIPKNVVSVFILDEDGSVKCERLILNKTGEEDYNVILKTEQINYGSRKKVIVNIEVKDSERNPVDANLSVAAVEKSRIDPDVYRNILNSYYYRFLDGANCNHFISEAIEKDIDDLLITKQWLNNNTQQISNYISKGPVKLLDNTGGTTGTIKQKYKGKFDVTKLTIISKEKGVIINVNPDKTFSIRPESLLSNRGNRWNMKNTTEFSQNYTVVFNNPDIKYDKSIIAGEALFVPTVFNAFVSNKPMELTKVSNGIQLKQVEIKGKSISDTYKITTVGCNAYICRNNILNCPNHRTDRGVPEEGRVYKSNNGPVVYRCRTSIHEENIKNIIIPKTFPLTDFDKEQIDVPALETTVYWNANLNTSVGGKNTFSFFTNDVKGDFLIIAQGIDVNTLKPIFGKTTFTVK